MSQADNKVRWCLKKADKELAEKGLHRGLIKAEPDIEAAKKHLIKAEHNLDAAVFFDESSFSDWAAPAFFYCIYHCMLAISRKFGYESRNQECTIALIDMLIEEGKIDFSREFTDTLKITDIEELHQDRVISLRESLQYGISLEFKEREKFDALLKLSKEAIEQAKKIILT